MKIYQLGIVVLSIIIFSGCGNTAMPNFYKGKYYMAGDDNCRKIRSISDTRIMCANKDGQEMGYRDAMTDQQISMYQSDRQYEQQEYQQLNQSMQNTNRNLQMQQQNFQLQQLNNNLMYRRFGY